MTLIWLYALVSVLIVSLISLVGITTLGVNDARLRSWLHYLISFSAGALLGDVFLHIFPEMVAQGQGLKQGVYVLAGILVFFALERFIVWHHSHAEHEEQVHSMVYLTMIGDSLHNFIDGLVIAASFLVNVQLGIASTLAVVLHEIPQEIGQFAILIHGGWAKRKALWYNFLSALTSIAGAVVVLAFARNLQTAPTFLLAFGASSFIYIAMSDLIPELHREVGLKKSFIQVSWLLLGIGFMSLLLLFD